MSAQDSAPSAGWFWPVVITTMRVAPMPITADTIDILDGIGVTTTMDGTMGMIDIIMDGIGIITVIMSMPTVDGVTGMMEDMVMVTSGTDIMIAETIGIGPISGNVIIYIGLMRGSGITDTRTMTKAQAMCLV